MNRLKPMKRQTLSILSSILLTSLITSAQVTVEGSINWLEASKSNPQIAYAFPRFEGASYDLDQPYLPKYCGTYEGSVAEAKLVSANYINVTSAERRAVESLNLGEQLELQSNIGYDQGKAVLTYCFYPFVRQNGKLKKVSSFKLSIIPKPELRAKRSGLQTFSTSSVLASGDWFKISVESDGVYKVTPNLLLEMGADLTDVAFNQVGVYGNGTGILPQNNSTPRKDDLQEIPTKAVDANNDGLFNGNDYILFFAKGPHEWDYDATDQRYEHTINFYRDQNFYFVTTSRFANRIAEQPESAGSSTNTVASFDDYAFKEDETVNLVGTGRKWLGDLFDFTLQYNYGFNFPDIIGTEPARLTVNIAGRSSTDGTQMVAASSINPNSPIVTIPFLAYNPGPGGNEVVEYEQSSAFTQTTPAFSIRLTYQNSANPTAFAYLNYLEVQVRRDLRYRGQDLQFRDIRSVGANNISEFSISNANGGLEVWDVTDINNAFKVEGQLDGNLNYVFKTETDSLREFVAVSGSDFPLPSKVGPVENQDLHGMQPVDMVIVSHANFLNSSENLAQYHRDNDNMTVEVVDVAHIYNEFGSGGLDISAIRDFMRMLYERQGGLDYLLLVGDASYDYKDRLANNNNFVPIFQSTESYSLDFSSISDDFYGFLDPGEGVALASDRLDIGIGRIPCVANSQLDNYINKVITYNNSQKSFGDWRNKVLLLADDVDEAWESRFVTRSEDLEDLVLASSKAFNVEKIYTDGYTQISTTGSQSYPEARADMFRKIQQGNLVTNYIGHGGEIGLSSERLIQLSDVNGWSNINNMPLFITITCEFTRLDDPKRTSAGEQLLLNPNGGAVALLSTTRVVGADPAIALNLRIFEILLTRPNNQPLTLGDMFRLSKNTLSGGTKFKFSLFGDPAIRLAIPFHNVATTSINGKDVATAALDTLEALSPVEIKGQVTDAQGIKLTNFNGILNVSVFDKPSLRETLVNDGVGSPIPFELQNNLIYKGKVSVTNGDFVVNFIVPLDISYKFGNGKISYYASTEATDAAGYFDTVIVGGINNNAAVDNEGPVIQLFMNDESFVRGGVTGTDPRLFALVADSSGVNTVGNGIGHDIRAELNGDTENSIVINEFYEADLNTFRSGKIQYPFFDLEPGEHTLKLKVFDIHNNFSEAQTEFIVAEDEKLVLRRVLNYPNPFTTHTDFQFEHNRDNQPLEVQVQIFTVSGKIVKTINSSVTSAGNRVTGITWNGLDDYGDKIGKGVYVYRVKVRSQLDNSQAEEYEKLVILR